jgi:hypothetical protein
MVFLHKHQIILLAKILPHHKNDEAMEKSQISWLWQFKARRDVVSRFSAVHINLNKPYQKKYGTAGCATRSTGMVWHPDCPCGLTPASSLLFL